MTLLFFLAFITHTGIRLLPWILIGEVRVYANSYKHMQFLKLINLYMLYMPTYVKCFYIRPTSSRRIHRYWGSLSPRWKFRRSFKMLLDHIPIYLHFIFQMCVIFLLNIQFYSIFQLICCICYKLISTPELTWSE